MNVASAGAVGCLLLLAGCAPAGDSALGEGVSTESHAVDRPDLSAPNLLWIVADDLGADKVNAYADDFPGYRASASYLPVTDNIDRLATAGLRFSTAWANPTCVPTRAAMLTGRYGFRTGVGSGDPDSPPLGLGEQTVVAALADAGYATALFGKWHLGTEGLAGGTDWGLPLGVTSEQRAEGANPLWFGWGTFDGSLDGEVEDYHHWTRVTSTSPDSATLLREEGYATDVTNAAALAWIQQAQAPWLAMVAYNAPHVAGSGESYQADDIDDSCPAAPVDESDIARFAALARCLDDRLGVLLASIPEEQLANTLIVFMGDNGTSPTVMEGTMISAGETGRGKGSTYESGVRVPLLIASGARWLELQACEDPSDCATADLRIESPGRVVEAPVSAVDLAATLANLGGVTLPTAEDSFDFSNCLFDVDCQGRGELYAEIFTEGEGTVGWGKFGLRDGDAKLVGDWSANDSCFDYRLYDLSADPGEENDLSRDDRQTFRRLRGDLDALGPPWMGKMDRCREGCSCGSVPAGGGGGGFAAVAMLLGWRRRERGPRGVAR